MKRDMNKMEMEDRGTTVARRARNFEQVGVRYMRLGRMRARMMVTCACIILRYAITLDSIIMRIFYIISLKIARDLPDGECQLLSSSAPDGFLSKKLLSNLVLSLNMSPGWSCLLC